MNVFAPVRASEFEAGCIGVGIVSVTWLVYLPLSAKSALW